jgi:hypothetical protein
VAGWASSKGSELVSAAVNKATADGSPPIEEVSASELLRTTSVPKAAAAYFGDLTPYVVQTFTPGKGWVRPAFAQPITYALAADLKGRGVTRVALANLRKAKDGADFAIGELVAYTGLAG